MRDRTAAARQLLRTGYALQRRVSVWKQIDEMGGLAAADAQAPPMDPKSMSALPRRDRVAHAGLGGGQGLAEVSVAGCPAGVVRPAEIGRGAAAGRPGPASAAAVEPVADDGAPAAVRRQRARWRRCTRKWSATPAIRSTPAGCSADLERYERTGLPSDARLLAEDCQYLAAGSSEAYRQLAAQVEQHYRNANLRLAVSEELLNRLVPKRPAEYAPVEDTVLGVPVRGQSLMASEVAVRLLPDPTRVRLALEVTARVSSLTSSTSGPATFVNDSESTYTARKPMEIDLKGITLWPTEVDVDNDSQLRRVHTDFDPVPLLGSVARGVARSQHEQSKPAADAEVREKIAARAQERIDRETDRQSDAGGPASCTRTCSARSRPCSWTRRWLPPRRPEQRFVMRVRLAGNDQLGSHTPRPQAPADSLASVQIHESAAEQRPRAARSGRPDVHACRARPADRRAAAPPAAEAVRSGPGRREDHLRRPERRAGPLRGRPARGDPVGGQAEQAAAAVEGLPGPRLLPARGPGTLDRAGPRRRRAVDRAAT